MPTDICTSGNGENLVQGRVEWEQTCGGGWGGGGDKLVPNGSGLERFHTPCSYLVETYLCALGRQGDR